MKIKQISVFVENKEGRLSEISTLLADAGIHIRALCMADTTDFGILRLIVSNPGNAQQVLKNAGLTVSLTQVIAVSIPDQVGGFSNAVKILSDAGISIEYLYPSIGRDSEHDNTAYIILRVNDNERAIAALQANSIPLLKESDLAHI
nr:amino acid-binding protein [uncultured Solibaculum sp.]